MVVIYRNTTKLGLFPYKPEKFTDTTYGENQTAIRGHDGSTVQLVMMIIEMTNSRNGKTFI